VLIAAKPASAPTGCGPASVLIAAKPASAPTGCGPASVLIAAECADFRTPFRESDNCQSELAGPKPGPAPKSGGSAPKKRI